MMPGGQSDHRARVESAAQIAPNRNVRAQPQAHGLLERVTNGRDVLGRGELTDIARGRVVEVPMPHMVSEAHQEPRAIIRV
jgi:hypothetical protein